MHIRTEEEIGEVPPRTDFVILVEDEEVDWEKAIFRVFRKINILEYKNPHDALNRRVLRKVCGYANLYIGVAEHEGDRPEDQVTVSVFRAVKNPDTGSFTVIVSKGATPAVVVPTLTAVTYDPAKTLANIGLHDGWAWVTGTIVPTVVNSGYDAVLTVDDDNYDYTGVEGYNATTQTVTRTVRLTVNKANPTFNAPTPKTLTYTGFEQELVNAGTAEGGKLYYAVTTVNKAPTDDNLYTTSIPAKTDAGT